jgi:3-hydroxyisobutyrate dehydrogenase
LICVSADADVLEVVETIRSALRPGSVVIDLSTVSIDTARTCAHIVASASSDFLDAPVTGGVEGAVAATLSVMVGGSKTALDRGRPALEAIGRRIVHMGGTGMGQAAKAVNQVMVAGINQAVTEALGFGASLDLDLNKLIEVIGNGAAGNWFLDRRGSSMVQGTFAPGFKMSLHAKDLRICRDIAEGIGLTLHQVNATLDDYAVLLEEGHGDEDISALYRLKRPNR